MGVPASDAAEDHAIQQGVAPQAVVAVDTTCNLSSGIQSNAGLPLGIHDQRVGINFQTTHAVVDHRRDDGKVEGLRLHCRCSNDVVVELLARAKFTACSSQDLPEGYAG